MFKITDHKGFQMGMKNGWTVSVQFGVGNYCSRRWETDFLAPRKDDMWESKTAEIAASKTDSGKVGREWYPFGEDEDVKGYCSPEEVIEFLSLVASFDNV